MTPDEFSRPDGSADATTLIQLDPAFVTAELNRVLEEAQAEPDPGVLGAGLATLRRAEW